MLSKMEQIYSKQSITFDYCFYENDSSDKTSSLLKAFMSEKLKNRKGFVQSEKLGSKLLVRSNGGRSIERVQNLANCRNKCFLKCKYDSDWTFIIDSDIYFNENTINIFLETYNKYKSQKIVMLTANTADGKGNYFDTWAHKDKNGRYFSQGYLTKKYGDAKIFSDDECDRKKWIKNEPIVVKSAFGGCALILTSVLKNCKWSAPNGCEHWEFCNMVQRYGNIVICPNVKCLNKESRK